MSDVNIQIPKAFSELNNDKWRYYIYYGPRGTAKSHTIARWLLIKALSETCKIGCYREIMGSINDSVHALFKALINKYELNDKFIINLNNIVCKETGSEIIYKGLYNNIDSIKSTEDLKYCWIEEAQSTSEDSFKILLPTIRIPGSKIYITFNPEYNTDPVYERFITNKPDNAYVKFVTQADNPYFTQENKDEMEQDRLYRPDDYKWIWLGELKGKGGKFWPLFNDQLHIRNLGNGLDGAKAYCAMVPTSNHYNSIIWLALIPNTGDKYNPYIKYIYNEWPTFDMFNDYYHNIRTKLQYTSIPDFLVIVNAPMRLPILYV